MVVTLSSSVLNPTAKGSEEIGKMASMLPRGWIEHVTMWSVRQHARLLCEAESHCCQFGCEHWVTAQFRDPEKKNKSQHRQTALPVLWNSDRAGCSLHHVLHILQQLYDKLRSFPFCEDNRTNMAVFLRSDKIMNTARRSWPFCECSVLLELGV